MIAFITFMQVIFAFMSCVSLSPRLRWCSEFCRRDCGGVVIQASLVSAQLRVPSLPSQTHWLWVWLLCLRLLLLWSCLVIIMLALWLSLLLFFVCCCGCYGC